MRILKVGLIALLVAVVFFIGLSGGQTTLLAHDVEHQSFMVQAGSFGEANAEWVAFAPNALKVHRGDTVMWHFNTFHNAHFGEDELIEGVIVPEINGQPLPQLNPALIFPSIENGAVYSGGEANTGTPFMTGEPLTFSMVMDLPVGNYLYYCDIHPGMVGSIEVVADDVAIPSPAEAEAAASDAVSAQLNQAGDTAQLSTFNTPAVSENGKLEIMAGTGEYGRISIQAFFSPLAVVQVGDSVTWSIPTDSVDPHTITSANYGGDEFKVMPQSNGTPIIALGEVFVPGAKNDIGAKDSFNSGFLTPGQSFTLSFTEPGVHSYVCRLHPGMFGVVVVQPSA